MSKRKKKHTTVSIDADIIKWIEEQIEKKRFSSVSHAVEYCLYQVMEKEKKEKDKKV